MKKKLKSRKLKPIVRRIKRCIRAELEDGWNKSKKIHQDMQFRENVQRVLNEFLKPMEYFTATVYLTFLSRKNLKNILKRCVIEVDEEHLKELLNYLEEQRLNA